MHRLQELFKASLPVVAVVLTLLVPGATGVSSASPSPAFTRVNALGVGTFATYAMVRTSNGTLHLIFQTTAPKSPAPNGLATRSISPAGFLGGQSQALTGWGTSIPGLVQLSNGKLEAVFGAVSPKPKQISGLWGIVSGNGTSWSAPVEVGSQSQDEAQSYGANVTAQRSGSTPVFTLSVAGGLTVQQGLGQGSPTKSILNGSDDFAGDIDSAVDAAGQQVVASWQSLAHKGGDFIQGVAPTVGKAERMPGELRNEVVISGRDAGPGVFGAYTTDGSHVSLLRYGGGSVPVGSLPGVTAKVLGTATGLDGRIWVIWGDENGGLAVTRSNKAVTKFEPIQQIGMHAFSLYRLGGDGRLGPLDLLVEMIPPSVKNKLQPAGTFHARVLPELSASTNVTAVKNKAGTVIAHSVAVHVTDAGDPVAGATAAAGGKSGKTAANGTVTLTLPASVSGTVKVAVTAAGYQALAAQASV